MQARAAAKTPHHAAAAEATRFGQDRPRIRNVRAVGLPARASGLQQGSPLSRAVPTLRAPMSRSFATAAILLALAGLVVASIFSRDRDPAPAAEKKLEMPLLSRMKGGEQKNNLHAKGGISSEYE